MRDVDVDGSDSARSNEGMKVVSDTHPPSRIFVGTGTVGAVSRSGGAGR